MSPLPLINSKKKQSVNSAHSSYTGYKSCKVIPINKKKCVQRVQTEIGTLAAVHGRVSGVRRSHLVEVIFKPQKIC